MNIKEYINYDPISGVFTWIKKRNRNEVGDTCNRLTDSGYGIVCFNQQTYRLHRLAFLFMEGKEPDEYVDHINGIKDDNRWCNLRKCSKSQNGLNVGLKNNNTSGHKGVSWRTDRNKWRVYLRVNQKIKHMGYFEDFDLACLVADEVRDKYHGEFARYA